ncbi:hypothetical protein Vafri_415 [Volvox africanus]|nr:hypothetical protein Vafri_415 [Volvox africanus]
MSMQISLEGCLPSATWRTVSTTIMPVGKSGVGNDDGDFAKDWRDGGGGRFIVDRELKAATAAVAGTIGAALAATVAGQLLLATSSLCNKVWDNWNALALIHATLLLAARVGCGRQLLGGLLPPSPTPRDPPPEMLLQVVAISPAGYLRSFWDKEPTVRVLSPCSSSADAAPPVEPRGRKIPGAAVAATGVQSVVATEVPVMILAVMLRFSVVALAVAVAILMVGAVTAVVLVGLVVMMAAAAVAAALPVDSK